MQRSRRNTIKRFALRFGLLILCLVQVFILLPHHNAPVGSNGGASSSPRGARTSRATASSTNPSAWPWMAPEMSTWPIRSTTESRYSLPMATLSVPGGPNRSARPPIHNAVVRRQLGPCGENPRGSCGYNRIQKFTSMGAFLLKRGSAGFDDAGYSPTDPRRWLRTLRATFSWPTRTTTGSRSSTPRAGLSSPGAVQEPATVSSAAPWGSRRTRRKNVDAADTGNNRIQKFSTAGIFIFTWGATGTGTTS